MNLELVGELYQGELGEADGAGTKATPLEPPVHLLEASPEGPAHSPSLLGGHTWALGLWNWLITAFTKLSIFTKFLEEMLPEPSIRKTMSCSCLGHSGEGGSTSPLRDSPRAQDLSLLVTRTHPFLTPAQNRAPKFPKVSKEATSVIHLLTPAQPAWFIKKKKKSGSCFPPSTSVVCTSPHGPPTPLSTTSPLCSNPWLGSLLMG